MEVLHYSPWDSVLEITKVAQEKGSDPFLWAIQVSSKLNSAGVSLPSLELANLLVQYICWENNVPIAWKFLEKALVLKIVPPLLVLGLLSIRVISYRRSCPAAFRLYMELLKRHAFALKEYTNLPNDDKIMNSLDAIIHFSRIFGVRSNKAGALLVQFVFSIIWQLVDTLLDDDGLLHLTPEKNSIWHTKPQEMEIDSPNNFDEKRIEHTERLLNLNTIMSVELIGQFLQNKVTSRILYLARQNMSTHWGKFTQRVQLLVENSSALRNSTVTTRKVFRQLISDSCKTLSQHFWGSSLQEFHALEQSRPLGTSASFCLGASRSALWLPLDMLLEDAMDASQVNATSAVEIITGLVKSLQAFNETSWHEVFLGLWMAALRLVQRERDPIEGPIPRLDSCMCMLLSITTLVVADLVEEEETASTDEIACGIVSKHQAAGKRRMDLIFSLQNLCGYQSLLTPPQAVITAANQAAAKAMMFTSDIHVDSAYFECVNIADMPINCSGNLHHLIVEACIARNLLDTSAYFWPGYVNGRINKLHQNVPTHMPGWSSFMKGSSLTQLMINALALTPASRYACNNISELFLLIISVQSQSTSLSWNFMSSFNASLSTGEHIT
ncbi:Hypothetical predicted protein [Olea europaea subsp. europaea]|uniref:Mediator of RNA polymerase II transcription subunit 33A n=2 Tax=Olea europaea subsp. europaea TaxID=158383 RepID=A0A8S0PTY9_OLEEU|nr:Hypothetical predicted protein [Olea europaea subsp. europaea]